MNETEVIIYGVRSRSAEDATECYLILSIETLKLLEDEDGVVQIDRMHRLDRSELNKVKIVDGPVPNGFTLVSETELRHTLQADKTTTYHPENLAKLPVTIPVDVVTLPLQILIHESFKNVH